MVKSKNKTKRGIPLDEVALNILRNRPRSMKTDRVFYSELHTQYLHGNVWRAYAIARKRAGLEDVRIHDMRHTFATRIIQGGAEQYSVQCLLGHKDSKSTQRYAHHSLESLRRAVKVLDSTSLAQSSGDVRKSVG